MAAHKRALHLHQLGRGPAQWGAGQRLHVHQEGPDGILLERHTLRRQALPNLPILQGSLGLICSDCETTSQVGTNKTANLIAMFGGRGLLVVATSLWAGVPHTVSLLSFSVCREGGLLANRSFPLLPFGIINPPPPAHSIALSRAHTQREGMKRGFDSSFTLCDCVCVLMMGT